jgi:L,D-transpeptidase catalytic domain
MRYAFDVGGSMRFNFFILIFLAFTACISNTNQRSPASTEAVSGTGEADPFTASSDLRVVVDVNPAVQKMVVYRGAEVAYTFPISSGRGTFDIPTNFNLNPGCSTTETGNFKPQTLREYHYSNTWLSKNPKTGRYDSGAEGALMQWSVFFNGGIAFHAASTMEASQAIGPKAPGDRGTGSGGCIRLYPWDARTFFNELAGCEGISSAPEPVCTKRDVSYASTRVGKENVIQVPRCLEFAPASKMPICNDYISSPDCSNAARPGHCNDPKQYTVEKRKRNVEIQITDSRPQAEIDAEKAKCRADEETFNQRKAECMGAKIGVDPHKNGSAFTQALAARTDKWQLSYQCNEQLYNEAHAAAAATAGTTTTPTTTATGAKTTATEVARPANETPAVETPKPKKRFLGGFGCDVGNILRSKENKRKCR